MEPFLFAGALLFDNKKIAALAVFRTVWETSNRPSNINCMVRTRTRVFRRSDICKGTTRRPI